MKTNLHLFLATTVLLLPATVLSQDGNATLIGSGTWATPGIWSSSPFAPINGQNGQNWNATVNANTVTVDVGVTIQSLAFGGGVIQGTNTLTLNAASTWSGGNMSTAGGVTNFNGGVTLTPANQSISGRTVSLAGVSTMASNNGVFYISNDGILTNSSTVGTVFTVNASGGGGAIRFQGNGSSGTFTNAGTLTKTGPGPFDIGLGVAFNNSGVVQLNQSTMSAGSGGTASGTFILSSGTQFDIGGGSYTMDAATVNGAGTFRATGGVVTFTGSSVANTGNLGLNGGTMTFGTDAVFTTSGGLQASSGTLNGSGTVTFNGGSTWNGGNMSTAGGVTNFNGGVTLTPASQSISGRTVSLAGVSTMTSNNGVFYISNDGILTNSSTVGTVFTVNASGGGGAIRFQGNGSSGTFTNAGTLTKTGPGPFDIGLGVVFNNSGVVQLNQSTMSAGSGGTASGTFILSSGTQFDIGGGSYTMDAATVNGAGTFRATGGVVTFTGSSVANTGNLGLNGGTMTFGTDAVFTTSGGLQASSGTLNGGGTVTFNGGSTWNGGDLSGAAGVTNFYGGAVIAPSGQTINGRTVNLRGTSELTTLNGTLNVINGGSLVNEAGAGLNINANGGGGSITLSAQGGTGTLVNAGVIHKSGPGPLNIDNGLVLDNTGTFHTSGNPVNISTVVAQHVGTSLTGGTWHVTGGGGSALNFNAGSNITTIGSGASVILDGAGASFSKINTLTTNQGGFTLKNDRDFTTTGAFSNSGSVTVDGSGTALTVGSGGSAAYTQTAGATVLVGRALIDASVFNLNGGELKGTGTIASSVFTSGSTTIAPGQSAGALTIDGNLTLSAGNTLAMEIGGLTQGTLYDYLDVNGTLTLAGMLDLDFIYGFENNILNSDILTLATADSAILGAFSNVASGSRLWTNTSKSFEVWYGAGSMFGENNLVITGAPEPSRMVLILLGLGGLLMRRSRSRNRAPLSPRNPVPSPRSSEDRSSVMNSVIVAMLFFPAWLQASTTYYDFDSGIVDFQNHFYLNSGSLPSNWSYLGTGGIGGSGAVREPGAFWDTAVWRQSLPNISGSTVTGTLMFRVNELRTDPGDATSAGFVLLDDPAGYRTGYLPSTYSFALLEIDRMAAGATRLEYESRSTSGNSDVTVPASVSSLLTPDSWYRLSVTFESLGTGPAGGLRVSGLIEDFGLTGAETPSTFLTYAPRVVDNLLGSELYLGFMGGTLGGKVGGAAAIDNFSIEVSGVPEPSRCGLLLAGMAVLCLRRRR